MGLAFVRNRWRRARNVRPRFMVHRRSSFWMEAHRNSTAQELKLSLRDSPPTNFLPQKRVTPVTSRVFVLPRSGVVRKRNCCQNGSRVQAHMVEQGALGMTFI